MIDTSVRTSGKKTLFKTGFMTFLIIAGLVLVNVAVFFSPEMSNRRLLKYVWYYCDYHHWPDWYATLLWIIAGGTVLFALVQFSWVQKRIQKTTPRFLSRSRMMPRPQNYSVWIVFGTIALFVLASFLIWYPPDDLMKQFTKFLYYRIYLQFGYLPFADLMEGGVVTWRLFVIPAVGTIVIVLLLRYRRKRGNNHGK